MNGTDPLRELPRSMFLWKTLLALDAISAHAFHAHGCMSGLELPVAMPVTHVLHLVLKTSAVAM